MSADKSREIVAKGPLPGTYIDANGNNHICIPEMMRFLDIEDTPEKRRFCAEKVNELLAKMNPGHLIIYREDG